MCFAALSEIRPVHSVREVPGPYPMRTPPSPYVALLFVRFCAGSKRVMPDVTAFFVTKQSFWHSPSYRFRAISHSMSEWMFRPRLVRL
jgi:hypothetical protein